MAATEFAIKRLNMKAEEPEFDLTSLEKIETYVTSIFATIPSAFWTASWSQKGLDTSAGRVLIKTALGELRRAAARNDPAPLDAITSLSLEKVD